MQPNQNHTPDHSNPNPMDHQPPHSGQHETHGKGRKSDHGIDHGKENKVYWRFAAMIATSVVIMHLLTFSNVNQPDHIYFSQVRVYMSIMMGAVMAIVMLLFMKSMYKNRLLNQIILVGSTVVFFVMFWMIQSQTGVNDVSWMRSMIPHHSSAIMTSDNANLQDPEVRKLADEIIRAQEEEIAEMRRLIEKLTVKP